MTEPSDLARLAAGVPVSILLPLCLPRTGYDGRFGTALAALLAAAVAAPLLPSAAAGVALLGPPAVVAVVSLLRPPPAEPDKPNTPRLRQGLAILVPALLVTAACLALVDPEATWEALESAIESNGVIVVASGALAAIFLGGPFVAWVLSPFAKSLDSDPSVDGTSSLRQAGTLIGWFERALFFAFIAGGEPRPPQSRSPPSPSPASPLSASMKRASPSTS